MGFEYGLSSVLNDLKAATGYANYWNNFYEELANHGVFELLELWNSYWLEHSWFIIHNCVFSLIQQNIQINPLTDMEYKLNMRRKQKSNPPSKELRT